MNGVIAPTDSRFRMDLRLFEEDEWVDADDDKILIEEEQRRKRKAMQEAGTTWKPNFFRKIEHPQLKDNDIINTLEDVPVLYELIEGEENGYWERRKRGDWQGLPQLFGPFEKK